MTLGARLRQIGVKGYTDEEVDFVLETMERLQPDFICEWGTGVGHSARMFHEARVELGLDCEIHSVEAGHPVPVLRETEQGLKCGHYVLGLPVELYRGDGVTEALNLWGWTERTRPLFYIDDNHEESSVFRALAMIAEAAPEAVILLHDAINGGPEFAANRIVAELGGYDLDRVVAGQTMMRMWPQ